MDGSGAIESLTTTSVAIASSSTLLRVGLRALADCPGCDLWGEVDSFERALGYLKQVAIGLLFLDEKLDGLTDPSKLAEVRTVSPDTKILVFSGQDGPIDAYRWLGRGAGGCVSTTGTFPQLRDAISTVLRGGVYIPFGAGIASNKDPISLRRKFGGLSSVLNRQQAEILDLVLAGYDSKTIARLLGLAVATVKMQIAACCRAMAEQRQRVATKGAACRSTDNESECSD